MLRAPDADALASDRVSLNVWPSRWAALLASVRARCQFAMFNGQLPHPHQFQAQQQQRGAISAKSSAAVGEVTALVNPAIETTAWEESSEPPDPLHGCWVMAEVLLALDAEPS